MSCSPTDQLANAILGHLVDGRSFDTIARSLGMDLLTLVRSVDLPQLIRQAAGLRELQQFSDYFAQSAARQKAIETLSFLIEHRAGSPETVRRAATAVIRAPRSIKFALRCGPAFRRACEFLQSTLAGGARPATEVQQLAAGQRIAARTLNRAKAELGILTLRYGFGPGAIYKWALPKSRAMDAAGHGLPMDCQGTRGNPCLTHTRDAKG